MKIKEIKTANDLKKVKNIYLNSFPKSERINFNKIKNKEFSQSNLWGIYKDDEQLIGFFFICCYIDFNYIVYFAIEQTQRNKGYGSQALTILINMYKEKNWFLCVEKPWFINDQQSKRIDFYKTSGFKLSFYEFYYNNQYFYPMFKGEFNKNKFIKFLNINFPSFKKFNKIVNLNNFSYELLDSKNINEGIKLQNLIFPNEKADIDLKNSLNNKQFDHFNLLQYWIVKNKGINIGICGLYSYKKYPKDAWLGWFGIIDEFRGNGYGRIILDYAFDYAQKIGFKNIRLYTDEIDNKAAIRLYRKLMMKEEIYNNKKDKHYEVGRTLIFSKSLTNKNIKNWGNKNLYLNIHDKQNNFILKY